MQVLLALKKVKFNYMFVATRTHNSLEEGVVTHIKQPCANTIPHSRHAKYLTEGNTDFVYYAIVVLSNMSNVADLQATYG